ncbi:MAG: hypothetical protein L0216_05555 [Planctomycetales bacterium]|nr:hypothetical protein [Planctomycetales bacterium]
MSAPAMGRANREIHRSAILWIGTGLRWCKTRRPSRSARTSPARSRTARCFITANLESAGNRAAISPVARARGRRRSRIRRR